MAIWKLLKQGETVKLAYERGGKVTECGEGSVALADHDLLAWVVDQAQPWSDAISTEDGMFFRQPTPFGNN